MSQIGLFIRDDIAILCGETILCYDDGSRGEIHKIHCSKNAILIGCSGRVESNAIFFKDLLNTQLQINDERLSSYTYSEVVKILDSRFEQLKAERLSDGYNIGSVIAGYDGKRISGMSYHIKDGKFERKCLIGDSEKFTYQMFGIMTSEDEFEVERISEDCVKNITIAFQNKLNQLVKYSTEVNDIMEAYVITTFNGEIIWWKVENT